MARCSHVISFNRPPLPVGIDFPPAHCNYTMALISYSQPTQVQANLYDMSELIAARDRLTEQIGDLDLGSINISDELMEQYKVIKRMLHDSANDDEIPLNQRASIANSCTTLLGQLVKMQADVWNADRLKKMEGAVFAAFKQLDKDERVELGAKFLEIYRKSLA